MGFNSSSWMMALYMPMQPSSRIPMMALCCLSWAARASPRRRSAAGISTFLSGRTWLVSCLTRPFSNHLRRARRNSGAAKSSAQRVEYFLPALVSEAFRLSIPTSPGHVPDQLATVRIGPLWLNSPAST